MLLIVLSCFESEIGSRKGVGIGSRAIKRPSVQVHWVGHGIQVNLGCLILKAPF